MNVIACHMCGEIIMKVSANPNVRVIIPSWSYRCNCGSCGSFSLTYTYPNENKGSLSSKGETHEKSSVRP